MNKERIHSTILIVLLVGMLVHELYFSELFETQEEVDDKTCSIEHVKEEIVSIIKHKKKPLYNKMFNSCKDGIEDGNSV